MYALIFKWNFRSTKIYSIIIVAWQRRSSTNDFFFSAKRAKRVKISFLWAPRSTHARNNKLHCFMWWWCVREIIFYRAYNREKPQETRGIKKCNISDIVSTTPSTNMRKYFASKFIRIIWSSYSRYLTVRVVNYVFLLCRDDGEASTTLSIELWIWIMIPLKKITI